MRIVQVMDDDDYLQLSNAIDRLEDAIRDLDCKADEIQDKLNDTYAQEHGIFSSLAVLIILLTRTSMSLGYAIFIALAVGFFFITSEQHSLRKKSELKELTLSNRQGEHKKAKPDASDRPRMDEDEQGDT